VGEAVTGRLGFRAPLGVCLPLCARLFAVSLAISLGVSLAVTPSARASDALTVNDTGLQGASGGIFAAPPGSCTATPGGTPGDCDARGAAIVTASSGTVPGITFWNDDTWSDLENAPVPLTEAGNTEVGLVEADGTVVPGGATPSPDSDIGTSWIPAFCAQPECGHLLRGDSLQFDENGDGVFDNTWIDKNNNGVRDVGEVDRTRGDQFQWGVTSVTRNLGDLSDQIAQGNMFPAGLARTRVRMSLGEAGQAGGCDVPSVTNPACLDGNISSDAVAAGGFIDDNTVNGQDVDTQWWGICDPDRFDPNNPDRRDLSITTAEEGQRALDNCLWWITSMPIFATDSTYSTIQGTALYGTAYDPNLPGDPALDFETHTEWLDQEVKADVFSSTPDRQDFGQSVLVTYDFDQNTDLDHSRYINEWQVLQQDVDPNEAINGPVAGEAYMGQVDTFGTAWSGVAVPAGPYKDTYSYAFAIQHRSVGRARGYDNGDIGADAQVTECALALAPASECDGTVNETVDPFWRAQLVGAAFALDGVSFNQDFEYHDGEPCDTGCRTSGVGAAQQFAFLTAQDVNGYFEECVNCATSTDTLFTPEPEFMPYLSAWDVVPTVVHGGI
jgi:hypothetical protein